MEVVVPKGKYIVAVSGGVDSVVLLDMLSKIEDPRSTINLVVAHFDHGIRPDSREDAEFVRNLAATYGLPFKSERAELGQGASEETARNARYAFLRKVKDQEGAKAIITAHHQDDLIETILLHMQRGTGRQGLTPMNTPDIMRPLLNTTKAEIIAYAHEHNVRWHEDRTNASSDYARNVVRKKLQANLTTENRKRIIAIHAESLQRNAEIDDLLKSVLAYVQDENDAIVRARFVTLPYAVCCELMMLWLKNNGIYDYDRKKITSLVIAVKTLLIGKKVDINNAYWLVSEKTSIKILRK